MIRYTVFQMPSLFHWLITEIQISCNVNNPVKKRVSGAGSEFLERGGRDGRTASLDSGEEVCAPKDYCLSMT